MAQVSIVINGQNYTMQCNDGEEPHLRKLAAYFDSQLSDVKSDVGHLGDIRLLLMTGLVVTDQLGDAKKRIAALEEQLRQPQTPGDVSEDTVIRDLDFVTKKIEALSEKLLHALS